MKLKFSYSRIMTNSLLSSYRFSIEESRALFVNRVFTLDGMMDTSKVRLSLSNNISHLTYKT